jgi:serine protease
VKDFEDGPDGVSVEWASDKEGALGSGTSLTHEFKVLGPHVITATVRDKLGASTQASLGITLIDTPAVATVLAPSPGQNIERGIPFTLQGEVLQNFMHLPCTWTSDSSTDLGFPLNACSGTVTFTTNGYRTLTLTGSDAYAVAGSTSISFNVVDPVLNGPPGVSIANPTPELGFVVGAQVSLNGSAVDPDGKTPITYEWRFRGDACAQEVTIATGPNVTWDTGAQAICGLGQGGATITLYATDPDNQTGSAWVHVNAMTPPN